MIALNPDVIGVTAITPSIYKAERVLEIAREACLTRCAFWAACTPPSCSSRC